MKVRLLHTTGQGKFEETIWDKPDIGPDEIEVKNIMTGVCRSDIDMMNGNFGPLPLNMQGHEGLGQVTKVGMYLTGVKVGDFVATRGEPAYADYYNVRKKEFVIVPEADPKYILEPIACGINVIYQNLELLATKKLPRILILGSGFLAWVAYNAIQRSQLRVKEVVVVGKNNKDLWGDILSEEYQGTFDIIVDLSDRTDVFDKPIVNNEAIVIFGAQKMVTTDFSNLLWKACTMIFPSPRTDKFHMAMIIAESWIRLNSLDISSFWTKGYDRDTEWQQAFEDGQNRPKNYSRGYIKWA
jgi:hypothetical protein